MKTRIFTLLFLFAVMHLYAVSSLTFEVDGLKFTTTGSSIVELSRSDKYTGAMTIPSEVTYASKTYSVTSIADNAFRDSYDLSSVILPSGITSIGEYAFAFCDKLTSVNLPGQLTNIGFGAFMYTSALTSVTIPESVTSIGNEAFSTSGAEIIVSNNNPNYASQNGVLFNKDLSILICCPASVTGKYDIPGSVTTLSSKAFYSCEKLKVVTIPTTVNNIGSGAFSMCMNLKTVWVNSSSPVYLSDDSFSAVSLESAILIVPTGKKGDYGQANNWKKFGTIYDISEVAAMPALSMLSSYPENNAINVSLNKNGALKFNSGVFVNKGLKLMRMTKTVNDYTVSDIAQENDSVLVINLSDYLDNGIQYTLSIPAGFVTNYFGSSWPASEQQIVFNTNTTNSIFKIDFSSSVDFNIDTIRWADTTTNVYQGSYSTSFSNLVIAGNYFGLKFERTGSSTIEHQTPTLSKEEIKEYYTEIFKNSYFNNFLGKPGLSLNGMVKFKLDFRDFEYPITQLLMHCTNYGPMTVNAYSGGIETNVYGNSSFSGSGYIDYTHTGNGLLDSIVFAGSENSLHYINLEITDTKKPFVDLGRDINMCATDSVLLDPGYFAGAKYTWSTGETTRKIWAKKTGEYIVTAKNTIGSVADTITISTPEKLTVNLPDTIFANIGETITLSVDTIKAYTYAWRYEHDAYATTLPTIKVTKGGMYRIWIDNNCEAVIDTVIVVFKMAKLSAVYLQGGMWGTNDVEAQLYKADTEGKYSLFLTKPMPQLVIFDSIPVGNYIMKAHFVSYSFQGVNQFVDTYHDGNTEWNKVVPLTLKHADEPMINILMAQKTSFDFNGTGVISGKVNVTGANKPNSVRRKVKSATLDDCNTRVLLFDSNNQLIATTCPDASGNYSFSGLPQGNYTVKVERTGFEMQSVFSTSLPDGGSVSNADFTINESTQTIQQGNTSGINNVGVQLFDFAMYPTPMQGKGFIYLKSNSNEATTICVSDLTGRILINNQVQLKAGENKFELDVTGLRGLYLVKVQTQNKIAVKQLIVK